MLLGDELPDLIELADHMAQERLDLFLRAFDALNALPDQQDALAVMYLM